MNMTLSSFIRSGGIPAEETFYLYHPEVFDGLFDCALDKVYLNRRVACGVLSRIRRKLYFERGLGSIPIRSGAEHERLLFWGCFDGDIMLASVCALFDSIGRRSKGTHRLVIGATDDSFDSSYAERIPAQFEKVFVLNCSVNHPRVHWYPLGRDGAGAEHFGIPPRPDKAIRVYCNFSPNTHPSRKAILEIAAGKAFVTQVDVQGYGLYTGYPMTNGEFLNQLNGHAFCICPRGAGYDTFRLWDCLHLGVVPIVVREAEFHKHLEHLPILFLDSIEDFDRLTERFLADTYAAMLETVYDFSLLTTGCWNSLFKNGPPMDGRKEPC